MGAHCRDTVAECKAKGRISGILDMRCGSQD